MHAPFLAICRIQNVTCGMVTKLDPQNLTVHKWLNLRQYRHLTHHVGSRWTVGLGREETNPVNTADYFINCVPAPSWLYLRVRTKDSPREDAIKPLDLTG